MSESNQFYFDSQGIILGYDREGYFCGVFVTEPEETFTKDELFADCFDNIAEYLIAADLSEWAFGTTEQVQSRIQHIIEQAIDGDVSLLTIKYHIPKTIH